MVATVGPFKGCVKVSAFFTVAFSRNRRNRKRSKWSKKKVGVAEADTYGYACRGDDTQADGKHLQ
jgi:hypothetical protein